MKLLFTGFILVLSVTAKCQLDKKTWLVGGNGSFYSYNEIFNTPSVNIITKYNNIDISAAIGNFIFDKLAVGLVPTFSFNKGTQSDGALVTSGSQISIGPFIRYYFLDKERAFNILSQISYQLGVNNSLSALKSSGKFNKFSAMAGAEMFFNSSVGLEILLGYKSTTQTIENSPDAFSNIRKGFQLSVGFQIHLEKK
jgi:hypothetical protein